MDFVDFNTFDKSSDGDSLLPQPQPALSLTNIESLSKRFTSNLNTNLSRILKSDGKQDKSQTINENERTQDDSIAEKYAQMSLSLLSKDKPVDDSVEVVNKSDSQVPSTNTLTTRLSRVLNDSLSDSHIREIFTHLEEKVINDDEYVTELIEPGVIGSMTRKKLRGKIETELIKNQSLILKEYAPLVKQLKAIESRLNKLNELNKSTNEKIIKNYQFSTDFNNQIKHLIDEQKLIGLKKSLLISFKDKFTLNEYEEFILTSGDLNEEFFTVLSKAETINENCSILLSIDNPQLGLKIINKSNHIINKARDRIVTYTNKTLSNLYSLNQKSRLVILHQCFRYLKTQFNYFSSIVTIFSETRSKSLVDEFYKQIQCDIDSNPSKSDLSRPIFLSAHDPVRFVGDLLAYVHSIAVNESETMNSIFLLDEIEDQKEREEFKSIIQDVLDKILKSLSRPVKSKVESIISSETKLSIIFQIFNLVELYSFMFDKQLKDAGNFVDTVKNLVKTCQDRIFMIITNRLATIRTSNSAQLELNLDLQPPEWIIEFYGDILPIVDQMTTETILNLPDEESSKFLKLIVNEPIEVFYQHVKDNKLFSNKLDLLIIKQNFLDLILTKIIPINLLSNKVLEINDMIDGLTQELIEYELQNILKNCNLLDYYNIINMICPFTDDFFEVSIYEPIKENKLYSIDGFVKTDEILQNYLPNAMIEIQQELLKLNSPIVVNEVVNSSFISLVKFYNKLNIINQEYLDFNFTWSDFDLATLLGIEDAYVKELEKSI
ncbi:COG6 [[Candida] subhashii]|uniref:Conserved oligomeric Golgi complex subunit 6 n=1 Tax=[Candida] subhashii TaxID=561895 RepID=A0A8J5UXX6_9ASCO|nr:COG6 [[Candida] subhashii]KAG7663935.1 COG6 [[Candida] subhashii]